MWTCVRCRDLLLCTVSLLPRPLYPLDRIMRGPGGRGVREVDPRRQLDVELSRRVQTHVRRLDAAVEHMPTALPVLADEVQMPAAHLDPLGEFREAKADDRAVQAGQLEDALVFDDIRQRPVRRFLPRHRTGANQLETSVDPQGAG